MTINVAGELEQMELKNVLSKNAYRSMADNHLWFSIFAYHLPSANRFTRIQRCTCCFVLLFVSIMMSILYYQTRKQINENESEEFDFTLGPFVLSKEEVINSKLFHDISIENTNEINFNYHKLINILYVFFFITYFIQTIRITEE